MFQRERCDELNSFKNIKKIGLGIVAFDATEHLCSIIAEIRDLIDYVVVGVQKVSYHGAPIAIDDYNEIIRLKDEDHLVDDIYEVELNLSKKPREQETDKRNHLINLCAEHGCSHCIIIDSDEFYPRKSFLKAIKEIDENDYPVSYCQYINYWFDYQHYLVYPFPQGQYVPFVSRVEYQFSFENSCFNLPSDPTRRYNLPVKGYTQQIVNNKPVNVPVYAVENHIFPWETVKMHHLSWIRANIRKKLNNWSSKKLFDNFEDLIDRSVERFESFSDDNMDVPAELLFNTPGHKVDIEKLPKQYIWPKYDFKTRLRKYWQEKKIVILIMSCNEKLFIEEEKVCMETYLKNVSKYPNIEFYFYRGKNTKEQEPNQDINWLDEESHVIHLNSEDDTYTFEKTIAAFKFLEEHGIKYDYILRTNTSTWVNIDLLNKFVGYLDNDTKNYCGAIESAWWAYHAFSMCGNAMIFPYRNVKEILLSPANAKFNSRGNADDVVMSVIFNGRYNKLKIDENHYYATLGVEYFPKYGEVIACPDSTFDKTMFIQIKNFFKADGTKVINEDPELYDIRKEEFEKMKTLESQYQEFMKNKPEDYVQTMYENVCNNIDKNWYVSKYIKKDFLDATDTWGWHFKPENRYDKETAIKLAKEWAAKDIEAKRKTQS